MKSEHRIQQEIILWFRNEYPELRGCLCYNNNNSVGGYRGKVNKFLGVVKGRSDLVLYYEGEAYMIELKTDSGKQRADQKEWQSKMLSHGFEYYIVRSLEDFERLIISIL